GRARPDGLALDLPAALQGPPQRQLVGVLEVAAHRQAARDPGDPHAERLEQPAEVHGRRLALEVGVGAQDDLGDALPLDAVEQLPHPQLVGADPLDRADRPLQHVVPAVELAGLLDRHQVAGLLDHADDAGVTAGVGADAALLALGDVEAGAAERHLLLDLGDGPGQAQGVLRVDLQQVEGDALGRLGPDAGEAAQLVDQVLDGTG